MPSPDNTSQTIAAADSDSDHSDVNCLVGPQKKKKPRMELSDSGMDSENELTNQTTADRSKPEHDIASEESSENSKEWTELATKTADVIASLDKAVEQTAKETPQSGESKDSSTSNDCLNASVVGRIKQDASESDSESDEPGPLRSTKDKHIPVTSPSRVGRLRLRKVVCPEADTAAADRQLLKNSSAYENTGRERGCIEDSDGTTKTSATVLTTEKRQNIPDSASSLSDSDDAEAFDNVSRNTKTRSLTVAESAKQPDNDSDSDSEETARQLTKKQRCMPETVKSKVSIM